MEHRVIQVKLGQMLLHILPVATSRVDATKLALKVHLVLLDDPELAGPLDSTACLARMGCLEVGIL
jgi:hypothetical protein